MTTTETNGVWHGHTDAATSPFTFFYVRESASEDIHPPQFEAVVARINELLKTKDGNGRPVAQLIFTRPIHTRPVVAFRFTSDWAHDTFYHELVTLGGSLGRGGFRPFSPETYDYEEYVK